jgi:NAD(P) transhydrogenase
MEKIQVDLAVIGSGPAGQKAAIQASKLGFSVAVIERAPDPGGRSLYNGTIPSKSLREAIIDLTRFYERGFKNVRCEAEEPKISDLNSRLQKVIEDEKSVVLRQFRKNNVQLIAGIARFENPKTLNVVDETYRLKYEVNAKNIIIATGSKPRNPIDVPFDGQVIFDSTTFLQMGRIPKTMVVLGGGIIGSEYASFLAALGCEVTIIDKRGHLLPMLDTEIGTHLQNAFLELNLKFVGNKSPKKISRINNGAIVECEDGTLFEAEAVLFALGRTADADALHLDNAGIAVDKKGYIPVNALFQTVHPHIYAVGDVIGGPSLASTSMEQGRIAARHACGIETHLFPKNFPIGIYTIPEISSCGVTEDEAKALGYKYEIGRAYYHEIARSHIAGVKIGMMKIVFHADTLEILGVQIIGRNATELVHIGQVAMAFSAKIPFFIDQVFNYPTFAECYRVAALNGYNKLKK